MIQSWVALPEAEEECAPAFDHYGPEALPIVTEGGLWMRLIAGTAFGLTSSVRTHSPLFYLHVVLQPGARIGLPQGYTERAAYIAKGRVATGGCDYAAGQMLVFGRDAEPTISAEEIGRASVSGQRGSV